MESDIIKRLDTIEKMLIELRSHLGLGKTANIADIRTQARKKVEMAIRREGKKHGS